MGLYVAKQSGGGGSFDKKQKKKVGSISAPENWVCNIIRSLSLEITLDDSAKSTP